MKSKKYCINDGKYTIEAFIIDCGTDLNITVCGGTKYHIGSCTISMPNSEIKSYCTDRHKDNIISEKFAKVLSSYFNCIVIVSVDIHIDYATKEEINILISNCDLLLKKIKDNYKKYDPNY